ncbi:MAG: 50S ribosomal protein L4 [Myxococcales bacterium]|nr:50S ribosomal protein L4 [Myxococcales bacterium]
MASVDVVNMQGEKVGSIELSDELFAAPVKEHLLWEVVVAQRAARRRGTAHTKGRSDVQGSTRKIYRQKGTGRARHGSIRAPIFVGGGTVFGPRNTRNFEKKVLKKVRRGALISALSLRARDGNLVVLEDLALGEIKTKRAIAVLGNVGVQSGLIVDDSGNTDLQKSVRNLATSKYVAPEGLNVYDLLRYPKLVLTRASVKAIEERLS